MSSVTRRSVLAATAVVGAAAAGAAAGWLTPRSQRAQPTPVGPTPRHAPMVEAAAVREATLIASLDATAAAHPALASRIVVLRSDHVAHLTSIRSLLAEAGVAAPSAAAVPSGSVGPSGAEVSPSSASPSGVAIAAPPTPLPSLAAVVSAERASAVAFNQDSLASTGTSAALFASISACDSTHVAWLS